MKSIRINYVKDGKDCVILVKKPTHSQLTQANLHAAAIFNQARKTGVCLRGQIDDWLEEQAIWSKDDREKVKELENSISEKLDKLKKGKDENGEKMKLSEARKLALEIKMERWRYNIYQLQRRQYDQYTVEGQTENARFDYLASLCLLDEEGKKLFKSVDEYYDNADEPHIIDGASRLANLMFGNDDFEKSLPENVFLTKHGLLNDKLELVNKKGERVNFENKVITEQEKVEEVEAEFENDLE